MSSSLKAGVPIPHIKMVLLETHTWQRKDSKTGRQPYRPTTCVNLLMRESGF